MARGRMLSKDISLDEKVEALSNDTARLLFTWMIPHLDVEGRMYGDARVFKSLVAPRRNYSTQKVEKTLTEMEKLGLIVRYSVDGNQYLFAPNFEKHQTGLRKERERQSQIPPPKTELRRSNVGEEQDIVPPKSKLSLSLSISKDKGKRVRIPFNPLNYGINLEGNKNRWSKEIQRRADLPDEEILAMPAPIRQLVIGFLLAFPATAERGRRIQSQVKEHTSE